MFADEKSAQPGLYRIWTSALVRKAMEGVVVEAIVLDKVIDRIMSKTTTCDPGNLLRSRKYIRNSHTLRNLRNWEQFSQDCWELVCWARAEHDENIGLLQVLQQDAEIEDMNMSFGTTPLRDPLLYRAFQTAKVGDVVDGWVKTDFGWM